MKKLTTLCGVLVSTALLLCGCALAGSPSPSTDNLEFNYSRLEKMEHPRLFMTEKDLSQLVKKIGKDKELSDLHAVAIGQADESLNAEPPVYQLDESAKRLLSESRKALTQILSLSYAYRTTGEERYAAAAEKVINTVCNFPSWNPKHFLDVGEMSLAVSIGYDWLYDYLSAETKALAVTKIDEYAFQTYGNQWFRTATNNWTQVCYAGMCSAAIAFWENYPERGKEIIEDAVKNNAPALIPMYSPDGNYPEGYGYWGYGTSFQVIMLSAFETVFGHCHGLDLTPGFERTAQFEMNMASTSSPSAFNFSDSSGDVSPQYCSWWFAAHFNDQSLLLMDRHLLQNGKYRGGESRLACFAPVWALHLKKGESSIPEYKVWSGMGNNPVVLIHTLWDFSENDKYLAFKGGQAYESHAHMDAGSFVYDAYNCRWAEDLGSENYARTERLMGELHGSYWDLSQESMRWDVFRCSNFAHNTLTINGQKHVTDGKSTIEEVFSEPALQGGRINLDPVFEGDAAAVCREFRLIDNSVLQITDKVTALDSLEARIQWRMVTPAAVEVTPDGITLTQKGKKITIKTACDDGQIPDYFSEPAWGNRVFDSKNEGHTVVGFTVLVKASKTLTFTTTIE